MGKQNLDKKRKIKKLGLTKNGKKMKLKLLRLKAKHLGLDPSGTREEIEARILENSAGPGNSGPENSQNCQPLSDEMSDTFTTEEGPSLLPKMMMKMELNESSWLPKMMTKMELNEKTDEKSRVSAFERLNKRKRKTPQKFFMPTIETLKAMGVDPENHEEFNIEKMETRAEVYNDMPTLRKRVKRFDEEVAPPFVNISIAKLKNLRLKRFEKKEEGDMEN